MKQFVLVINGANMNLTGSREPAIYGLRSFEDFLPELKSEFNLLEIQYFQSNLEGELINEIQRGGADTNCLGIVLNAGGYSHTSVAIADAVAAISVPVISVHISNIFSRERERHFDLVGSRCKGVISGLGLKGYALAIEALTSGTISGS